MPISDDMQSSLMRMTYAAQCCHPMTPGIKKTLNTVVWPYLYKIPSKDYLKDINQLLTCPDSLSMEPFTENHADDEIRCYLEQLAHEIEMEFPTAIRSGGTATESGVWQCVEHPEFSRIFNEGEVLPDIKGHRLVWELKTDLQNISAEDALIKEFSTYYLPKSIQSAICLGEAEEYAEASVTRLLSQLQIKEVARLVSLLRAVAADQQHSIVKAIERQTGFQWSSKEENSNFLKDLALHMAACLTEKIPNSL